MSEDLLSITKISSEIAAKAAADAAATVASRAFKQMENIIQKIDNLSITIKELDNCFDRFKLGIGQRIQIIEGKVGDQKSSLAVLENKVETILWVLRGVAAPILGGIGLAVLCCLSWYVIYKK